MGRTDGTNSRKQGHKKGRKDLTGHQKKEGRPEQAGAGWKDQTGYTKHRTAKQADKTPKKSD